MDGSRRGALIVGIMLSVFTVAFQSIGLATALPTMMNHFDAAHLYPWAFTTMVSGMLRARIDPDDLTEALGALLENAMRHTNEIVETSVRAEGRHIIIAIRDDGRGVPEQDLKRLTQRGLSLDPSGQGQGIGLAVVADIVDAAQGELRLSNARPGFLAELRFDALP